MLTGSVRFSIGVFPRVCRGFPGFCVYPTTIFPQVTTDPTTGIVQYRNLHGFRPLRKKDLIYRVLAFLMFCS